MERKLWFLLYGGSSADGRGPGRYEGRTDDPEVARAHHEKIRANPYTTGYVQIIDDTDAWCLFPFYDWSVKKPQRRR